MNEAPKTNRCWGITRRIVIALAILATLIAAFYTEEDWRGKRAWENCKRKLEAQGVVLDWNKFLPPSVPDDQNFYTASTNILLRFSLQDVAHPAEAQDNNWLSLQITESNTFPVLDTSTSRLVVVGTIIISPSTISSRQPDTNTLTLALNDPAATGKAQGLIRATVGQSINGVQGFKFSERQLTNIQPAQIFVRAQTPPSLSDLQSLVAPDSVTNIGQLRIAPTANQNVFQVSLTDVRITAAADYLKWSDQFLPAFNEIREALKRPYAVIPGDYSNPAFIPIPNFVTMRALAQTLGERAQCYLLLGEPDKALHELTLIHDVCRILQRPPTGQPETLVEAMINTAIASLYVQIIADGLQRHEWQEPQLIALQNQLKKTDLFPFVYEAFREGPTHIIQVAEIGIPPYWGSSKLFRWSVPRGWIYQMMVVAVKLECKNLAGVDLEKNTISPKKLNETMHDINKSLNRRSPFNLLARIAIPNVVKAWQTTAHNQTLVNEAQIACALERYRLAHGEYPETLDALTPQFIETVPHDLIGGRPLHYRRTSDGRYLLYSVGWNEQDDGGQFSPPKNEGHGTDYSKGDWVWEN